jgi:transposase InsO family protein
MATFGKIEPFSGKAEDLDCYLERLELYLFANDLGNLDLRDDNSNQAAVIARENKRRAVFLSVIGGPIYSVLRNLVSPAKPTDKSYDDLVKALKDHYNPAASVAVSRFKFHSRNKLAGESVGNYVSELRKLAEDCNFGETLSDMLRDRLLCGINEDNIQKKLLITKNLTFDTAYQIAVAHELAVKNASVLQGASGSANINTVTTGFRGKGRGRGTGRGHGQNHKEWQPTTTTSSQDQSKSQSKYCYRCGNPQHNADKCVHSKTKCNYCKKIGHLAKVCFKLKNKKTQSTVNNVQDPEQSDSQFDDVLYTVPNKDKNSDPIYVDTTIDGKPVKFQLDTGASVSVMNHGEFINLLGSKPLLATSRNLGSYSGHKIEVVGECEVQVSVGDREQNLPLVVVQGNGPPLMGRSWLHSIKLPWRSIFSDRSIPSDTVNYMSQMPEEILTEFKDLFKDELGCMSGFKARLEVSESEPPVFCKARPIPFSMKTRVEKELHKLESAGVIEKIQFSDWATPIVPVVKPSGSIRVCGDYKITINKVVKLDRYPLPLVDEILTKLSGGKYFTKLDLSQAYHQIQLDEESRKFTVINTPFGLYQYLRLPYGASPCVGLFQRAMENLLKGLPGVSVFLDDILIVGKSQDDHLANLKKVLLVLQEHGLRLQKQKCQFALTEVEYLGFRISSKGIHPTVPKVQAIHSAKAPTCVSELRSFVGLVNYYSRFLPNLAHHMSPLYGLLKKDVSWKWTEQEQGAFDKIKGLISHEATLCHYDQNSELVLSCDASSVGIGAVLEISENGVLKPLAFASRSLTKPERHYAQIEREALGIVFGLQKFRQYLLGRHFILRTDHRPLTKLLGENEGIPQLASSRIKRWALILSAYSYKIQYISSRENGSADFLSRLPMEGVMDKEAFTSELVLSVDSEILTNVPLTAKVIAAETVKNSVLSRVMRITKDGWPESCEKEEYKPYFNRRNQLSVEQNCLLWGERVVIPDTLRSNLLLDLHETHIGVARMKSIARQHFWWPKLDYEIENIAKTCVECQQHAKLPTKVLTAAWNWPSGPWRRLHMDYAGPFMGHMFLVVIDSYSKWLEVFPLKSATTDSTVRCLRSLFSVHGLPEHLVTDNGTQFTSFDFQKFLNANGIKHTTTSPGHPATNGMAERYVGFLKNHLKKMSDSLTLEEKICRLLLNYRTTAHPATGETPSALLMKRELRTRFSLLKPSLNINKESQIYEKNVLCQASYKVGDLVFALNLRSGPRWLPGVIVDCLERNYHVQVGSMVWKRHENQLRPRSPLYNPENIGESTSGNVPAVNPTEVNPVPVPSVPSETGNLDNASAQISDDPNGNKTHSSVCFPKSPTPSVLPASRVFTPNVQSSAITGERHSSRISNPPVYLKDYVT